ncbi:TPA: hypothetical protein ACM5XB_002012, partial [Neisseria gonorrhoeae]
VLGKVAATWKVPSPQPSPTGEGVGFGRFFGCRRFERQLRFAAVVSGRLKSKNSLHNLFSWNSALKRV